MASDNPSSNLERAAEAAEDFEKKHYKGGELDKDDFKQAGENATSAISDAANKVKEALVGPADPQVCIFAYQCMIQHARAANRPAVICKRYLPISSTALLPWCAAGSDMVSVG